MSERKIFDIRKYILLLGVFLVVLFSSTTGVFAVNLEDSNTGVTVKSVGNTIYTDGTMFIKVYKNNEVWIDSTITGTWVKKPTSISDANTTKYEIKITSSDNKLSVLTSPINNVSSVSATVDNGWSQAASYENTSRLYGRPKFQFTMPKGYKVTRTVRTCDRTIDPIAFRPVYQVACDTPSTEDRTCDICIPLNLSSMTLRTNDGNIHKGYGHSLYLTAHNYSISYNLNGGSISGQKTSYNVETDSFTLPTPTRTGYTFAGWTGTGLSAATKTVTVPKGSVGDRSYTANWTRNTYSISYTLNGGSISGQPTSYTIESAAFTIPKPTRSGYTFAGWTGTGLTSATQTVTVPKGSSGNRSYTATWTANTGKVTYNGNGHTGGSTAQSNYTYDTTNTLSANGFTKTGYNFAGWNTKSDGTGTTYAASTANNGIKTLFPSGSGTVYAKWTAKTGTVTYKSNYTNGPADKTQSYTYNSTNPLANNTFTRTGYTFKGWYTAASGGTQLTSSNFKTYFSSGSGTVYAQWTPITYTVAYNNNGGSGTMASVTHTYDVAKKLTKNTFTKPGAVFKGWATSEARADAGTVDHTDEKEVKNLRSSSGTYTLYAVWTPVMTVKYNANGGTITDSPHLNGSTYYKLTSNMVQYSTSANGTYSDYVSRFNPTLTYCNLLNIGTYNATRTGYRIDGTKAYALNANGTGTLFNQDSSSSSTTNPVTTKLLNGGTELTADKTITLYVNWIPNTYTVTYNGNGNTGGSTANSSHTYGTAKALTANGFTRTGYSFKGWNTKPDGSGTAYTNSQSVSNLTATNGGTVTLYAQWTPYTMTLKYHANGGVGKNMTTATRYRVGTDGIVEISSDSGATWKDLTATISTATEHAGLHNIGSYITGGYEISKTGYRVEAARGFNTAANGTGVNLHQDDSATNTTNVVTTKRINGGTEISSNVTKTIYVNWLVNSYNIAYAGMDGATYGTNHPTTATYDAAFTVNNPTKRGYTFLGWKITGMDSTTHNIGAGTSTATSVASTKETSFKNLHSLHNNTVTFTALWSANKGVIEFDANGGEGIMSDQPYTYDSTTNLNPNKFVNDGYRFTSWNTERDGSGTHYANKHGIVTAWPNGGNVTLYAQWEKLDYKIHFDGNGSTEGSMTDQTANRNFKTTLKPNTYIKSGQVFSKWNTDKNGRGMSYKDKSAIVVNSNLLNGTDEPIIRNDSSNWKYETFYYATNNNAVGRRLVAVNDSPIPGLTKAIEYDGGGRYDVAQAAVPVEIGKTYTMSCYVKGNGNLILQTGNGTYSAVSTPINSNEWKLVTRTFVAGTDGSATSGFTNIYFGNNNSNASEKLYVIGMKLEEGTTATPYITENNVLNLYAQWSNGSFSLKGDTIASGYKFEKLYPTNGNIKFQTQLGHLQDFSIFDLDAGSTYEITEEKSKLYAPSYEATQGRAYVDTYKDSAFRNETLSTPEELLSANMGYTWTNNFDNHSDGKSLSFEKRLAGDMLTLADKNKEFTFRFIITGLDPDYAYTYKKDAVNEADEIESSFMPQTTLSSGQTGYETSGTIDSTIKLKNTESFTIDGLPEGAKYNVTEVFAETASFLPTDWDYKTTYNVTSGAEDTRKDFDTNENKLLPYGLSINADGEQNSAGLGVETMGENDVNYVFKNAKVSNHDLTVKKQVTVDGANASSTDEFEMTLNLAGLTPNATYGASNATYNIVADENGKAEVTFKLKTGESITFRNLPSDVDYEVTEAETLYTANVKVNAPNTVYETSGMFGDGVSVSNDALMIDSDDEIGLRADQTVLFTNNRNTKHSLMVEKAVDGDSSNEDDEFTFNVDFTGLSGGPFSVVKSQLDANGNETTTTSSFNASGNYTYTFKLKANESVKINGIPDKSTFKITEVGAEGYIPSYNSDSVVSKASDTGTLGESLSTATETLITDTEYFFRNQKDNPPPVKKVSDTDNFKLDGEGPERLVEENSVPDRDKTWTYTVTQRIYQGFDEFTFDDFIPENTLLNGDVSIKWTKENGQVVQNALVQVVEGGKPVENQYTSGTFYVDLDNGVHVTSNDSALINAGGTFEVTIPVKVNPEATIDDFKAAGQIYKVNERLQFKNRASTTVGTPDFTNKYSSNLVKTNIPLNTALNIKKNVTGNLGDLTKRFEYEVKLSGLTPNKKYTYEKPTYVMVHGDYDEDGYITITATDENGNPIRNVEIEVYQAEEEEPTEVDPADEEELGEITSEDDEEVSGEPNYILVAKRKTSTEGIARFMLEPGDYKYILSYDDEKAEGLFTADILGEGEETTTTVEELDEVYFERTDYDTEKYFLTDENGEAVIEFKLADEEEMLFTKLPINVIYEVTEKASNHTPSFEVTEGVVATRSKAMEDKEVEITTGPEVLKGTTSYLFTNHRELEPRTAGYVMLVPMLILTLAGLIAALFFGRKKKILSE